MSQDRRSASWQGAAGRFGAERNVDSTIGGRILSIRRAKGLTLAEVSGLTGIPVLLLREYEAGLTRVYPPDCVRICDALDVGLPELFHDFG